MLSKMKKTPVIYQLTIDELCHQNTWNHMVQHETSQNNIFPFHWQRNHAGLFSGIVLFKLND